MLRIYSILFVLHAYIGWRLMPDLLAFGPLTAGLLAAGLAFSVWLMPQGLFARRRSTSGGVVWAGAIAMGLFSSLFVLTFLRDAALLAAGALDLAYPGAIALRELQAWSAMAVPALAAVLTLVGLYNARRRAVVRSVDVTIAGLPAA